MTIPFTCIDDFYSDPDKIRDWALTLEFKRPSGISHYPGERTDHIHLIDENFFKLFCEKLFSIFYDYETPVNWICTTKFQKIYPFHKDYNNSLNSGWVHIDDECVFAGVIYLNKNSTPNSGTSIFYPKDTVIEELDFSYRNNFYSNNNTISKDEYAEKIEEHNKKFELSIEVKNKYNRLICYDGNTWHKESNFSMEYDDFRLTQVFFIKKMSACSFPRMRVKNISHL
jgi:hypothetical protein